jgi:hypothetical protein
MPLGKQAKTLARNQVEALLCLVGAGRSSFDLRLELDEYRLELSQMLLIERGLPQKRLSIEDISGLEKVGEETACHPLVAQNLAL